MNTPDKKVTGVFWDKRKNKWIAHIYKKGKEIYLGSFENFEEAVQIRKQAEERLKIAGSDPFLIDYVIDLLHQETLDRMDMKKDLQSNDPERRLWAEIRWKERKKYYERAIEEIKQKQLKKGEAS